MTLTYKRPVAVTIQVADYPLMYGNRDGCFFRSEERVGVAA